MMDIKELYNYINHIDPNSLLPGYRVKAHHFDHIKNKIQKKQFEIATFKKKRGYLGGRRLPSYKNWTDGIERRSNQTPGPWKYDQKSSWLTGPKAKSLEPYLRVETAD